MRSNYPARWFDIACRSKFTVLNISNFKAMSNCKLGKVKFIVKYKLYGNVHTATGCKSICS